LFFGKINSKWRTKKSSFFSSANSQYFLQKWQGLVLWLLGLIDAKGIGVAQSIWL
jgi:hypothetical protein